MSSVTWKDVVDLDEIYLRSACKSPASNTAYLTLRSSHCRSTCRPAHMTPNFLFFVWRKLAVILNSAVYHIAMTTCKSTRQDLLLESIQNFVCCCLTFRLQTLQRTYLQQMKTNSHIQIALLSIHIILIFTAIMLKSKIYFPKISLFSCPFAYNTLIKMTVSGTHFIYLFIYFCFAKCTTYKIR